MSFCAQIGTATTAEILHDGLPSIGSVGHFSGILSLFLGFPRAWCGR